MHVLDDYNQKSKSLRDEPKDFVQYVLAHIDHDLIPLFPK